MADTKVSALTAATKLLQTSLAYVVQGGASLSATIAQFLTAGAPDQTASAQAGNSVAIAASDAVAGSSNAGAAAGGNVTRTAGDAKRLTSGNANGGDIIDTPGAGIGTGTAGKYIVRQPGGVAGTDEVQIYDDGTESIIQSKQTAGLYLRSANGNGVRIIDFASGSRMDSDTGTLFVAGNTGDIVVGASTVSSLVLTNTVARLGSGSLFGFANNGNPYGAATDVAIKRLAASVMGLSNANDGSGAGWLQQTAGRSRVTTSNVTNATTTFAAITGCSATVIAGRKYSGRLVVFCDDSTAADGIKFDFSAGTATWTSFRAALSGNGQVGVTGVTVSAAINTALTITAMNGTTVHCFVYEFAGVCNAAGTFIPEFAQVAHTAGTATVYVDTTMSLEDLP